MICVQDKQSLTFEFGGCSVPVFYTVVFFALIHASRGQSGTIGPSQPIVAMVGDDIILPCHLDPVTNAFDMTVEWARPDLDPRFVLLWRDRVELEKKHPSYNGRTSLFTDELKNGNISLKLSKVKLSDKGTYRCFVPGFVRDATVQLVVGAVSSPVIMMNKNNSGVVLQCESKGWYPEPEVLWLDSEGNLLSAGPTETVRGPDDLYTVSSRVTVEKRHSNNITCRVQQKNINQTREIQIHVPDYFFQGSPRSDSSSSSSASAIIGVVVGVMFVLGAMLAVWKWRRNKLKKKKNHDDEESQKLREKSISKSNNSEQECMLEKHRELSEDVETVGTVNMISPSCEDTGHQSQIAEEPRQREGYFGMVQTPGQTEKHQEQPLTSTELNLKRTNGEDAKKSNTEGVHSNKSDNSHLQCVTEIRKDQEEIEESQTANNLQREEEDEEIQLEGDKTTAHQEERKGVNDLSKMVENLENKLKTTEREQKKYEDNISRYTKQEKDKEEQIKKLKLQLKELKRQREEAERKFQSQNKEEDNMDPETQKDSAEKGECPEKDLIHSLEKEIEKMEKEIEKTEKELERIKNQTFINNNKKLKSEIKKTEIIKKLEEIEKEAQYFSQSTKT